MECCGFDSLVVIPEEIEGLAVIALAPYLFSVHENHNDRQHLDTFGGPLQEKEYLNRRQKNCQK